MKHCEEITFLISESQDHQLTLAERFRLKIHLMMCNHCRTYEQSIFQIRDLMQEYSKLEQIRMSSGHRQDSHRF